MKACNNCGKIGHMQTVCKASNKDKPKGVHKVEQNKNYNVSESDLSSDNEKNFEDLFSVNCSSIKIGPQ